MDVKRVNIETATGVGSELNPRSRNRIVNLSFPSIESYASLVVSVKVLRTKSISYTLAANGRVEF